MSKFKLSKSYILSRCSQVLNELELLMSQFNSIDDEDDDYDDDSLWWDDDSNNNQLCDSLNESLPQSDIVWPVFSSSPTTPITMLSTTTEQEYEFPRSAKDEKVIETAAKDEEMIETAAKDEMIEMAAESDKMITNALAALNYLAPNSTYDSKKAKKRRMKKMKSRICPKLRSIWTNAITIITPVQRSSTTTSPTYPKVDWSSVNKRFLSNLPTPAPQPILGCSQDQKFYEKKVFWEAGGTSQTIPAAFFTTNPFGSLPGFRTNMGVIAVPEDNIFHGYTWVEKDGWILNARFSSKSKKRRMMMKMNTKKKK